MHEANGHVRTRARIAPFTVSLTLSGKTTSLCLLFMHLPHIHRLDMTVHDEFAHVKQRLLNGHMYNIYYAKDAVHLRSRKIAERRARALRALRAFRYLTSALTHTTAGRTCAASAWPRCSESQSAVRKRCTTSRTHR